MLNMNMLNCFILYSNGNEFYTIFFTLLIIGLQLENKKKSNKKIKKPTKYKINNFIPNRGKILNANLPK